jgi:hypothetical protein
MCKQPLWDYANLSQAITFCIRQGGYPFRISVTYPTPGNKVTVHCSDPLNKFANNTCVRVMCVLTCLCILFAPAYFCARKKTSNRLVCEYPMLLPSQEFYMRNYFLIQMNAINRYQSHQLIRAL